MVAATSGSGSRTRLAFPLIDSERNFGIEVHDRLTDFHIVVVHGRRDSHARGHKRSTVTIDVVGDLLKRNCLVLNEEL